MIEPESFCLKCKQGKKGKNHQSDDFLQYFELPQIKRTSIGSVAISIGRNLKAVFEKCNSPADQNNGE